MPKRRPYWLCPGCGTRNPRVKQKCAGDGCRRSRPRRREPDHAVALRGDNYHSVYVPFAAEVHGVTDESCCLCGKPRSQTDRHHRDHGHLKGSLSFGKPRGILCFRCNALLPREVTAEWLEKAHAYLRRVDDHYSKGVNEGAVSAG